MIERKGIIKAEVVECTNQEILGPIILKNVDLDANVTTDEWYAYNNLNGRYNHNSINHCAKQYVNGMAHTNGMENFWSHLKRGVDGIYHWVSKEHLQSYVTEFIKRLNTRDNSTSNRLDLISSNSIGRLTYKTLING
jgi:hypothetical protein